jgi:hypothetical protein
MSGLGIQFRARSQIIQTKGGQAMTFGFSLGPLAFFVIANLPKDVDNKNGPLVYIKVDLRINEDWQEYSTESR